MSIKQSTQYLGESQDPFDNYEINNKGDESGMNLVNKNSGAVLDNSQIDYSQKDRSPVNRSSTLNISKNRQGFQSVLDSYTKGKSTRQVLKKESYEPKVSYKDSLSKSHFSLSN